MLTFVVLVCCAAVVAVYLLLTVERWRLRYLSRPVFRYFKRVLPPLSTTEREAMEAGTVWWDAELFTGKLVGQNCTTNEPAAECNRTALFRYPRRSTS